MPDKKEPTSNSTPRRANPAAGCPPTAALAAVGGKWKMIIVYRLAKDVHISSDMGRQGASDSLRLCGVAPRRR